MSERNEELPLKTAQSTAQSPYPTSPPPHRRYSLLSLLSARVGFFVLFNIFYSVIFATHFARLWRFAAEQPHYPHFSLIFLVSLYLIVIRWQTLYPVAEYSAQGGIPIMLIGGLCYVVGFKLGHGLNQHDFIALSTAGVVLVWTGGFVTLFGLPAARLAVFPLSFLVFAIPLPEKLLSIVITALQYASAEITAVLFQLLPLPVLREGLVFMLPGLTIEVARECSSIRSSMALLITGVLICHLFLRRWRSRAVILLLVFPLAVFKNGVRIVTLSLLTLYVDRGFMTGDLHTRGGVVFFGLALIILLACLVALRKLEAQQGASEQETLRATET